MLDFDVQQHELRSTSILSSSCLTRAGNNVSGLILFWRQGPEDQIGKQQTRDMRHARDLGQLPVTARKLRQTPRAKQDPGG
jgi:hypothetical protein